MKFLLECVGYYATTSSSSSTSTTTTITSSADLLSPTEETRSLVAVRRRKRRGHTANANNSAADWRPSLFAISEDNVAVAVEKAERREKEAAARAGSGSGGSNRNVKRCGPASARSTRSYDYRHDPLPLVAPVFSAAPFMF